MRIGPAYFTALLLTVVILVTCFQPVDPVLGQQVAHSVLFLQSFYPKKYVLELNSPAWSVSVEMVFYVLFPLLLLLTRYKKIFIYFTIFAYLLSQFIHLYLAPKLLGISGSAIFYHPLIHMNQFLIGITGGILLLHYPDLLKRKHLSFLFFAIIILLVMIRPENISYNDGLIAPLFMLLIVSISSNNIRWLNSKLLIFLGEISFGIYIYQMPVYKYLSKINITHLHQSENLFFYSSFALLIIVSTISYYFIEQPILKFFKKKRAPSITEL